MGFFDFIGNKPDQLSLPEILSAIPAIAGPALMQRGGRIGLPLGMGLTAFGGLGQELAQKRQKSAQNQGILKLLKGMPGVTPEMAKSFDDAANEGGVDLSGIYEDLLKSESKTTGMKPFPISNGKEERIFDPAKEGSNIPAGWFSSSFKPGASKTTPLKTIYGPGGATQEVGISAGYTPPAGWSLKSPDKPITINNLPPPLSPSDLVQDPVTHKWGVYGRDGNFRAVADQPPNRLPEAPKPPTTAEVKTQVNVNGKPYDYRLTHKGGDTNTGIARASANTLPGRLGLSSGVPQIMWRINGKYVDPTTLSKEQATAYAKILQSKGFSMDEILPPSEK